MPETNPGESKPGDAPGDGLSRRQVLGAAAWATPAIVVATGVPAYAASGGLVTVDAIAATGSGTVITVNGQPQDDPWRIFVSVTNHSADNETVTVTLSATNGTFENDDVTDQAIISAGATILLSGFGGLLMPNNKKESLTATPMFEPSGEVGTPLTVFIKAGNPIPYTGV